MDKPIGQYHPGLLYSESFSGMFDEATLNGPTFGVGRDDIQATVRLIVLLHETSHYLHDLSLGTCLNSDFLLDEAAGVTWSLLASLTSAQEVVCPIVDFEWNTKDQTQREREAVKFIVEREGLANFPRSQPTIVNVGSLALDPESGLTDETVLTGEHLLEGIVALKTMIGLAQRANNKKDRAYLRGIAKDLPLLPDSLEATYHVALRLFDAMIGPLLAETNPRRLRSWPDDVYDTAENVRLLTDFGFLMVADIALHVPPTEVIFERVKSGRNEPLDFQPVPRFLKAMEVLRRHGGFPPAGEGGSQGFYQVLYDWLAEKLDWPSYDETQGGWEAKLAVFHEKRRLMSDRYRLRMVLERRKNSMSVLFNEATFACALQAVPVIHLTPTGLKILRTIVTGKNVFSIPFESPTMSVWELWNLEEAVQDSTWQKLKEDSTSLDPYEAMGREILRAEVLLQEIMIRSMCRALQSAVLKENSLRCPWAERGCHVAQTKCKKIQRLSDVPHHECALRKYAESRGINVNRVVWENERRSRQ